MTPTPVTPTPDSVVSVHAAIDGVLRHEVGQLWETGGYTDDPDDPGGATKWGISLRYAKGLPLRLGDIDGDGDVDRDDIRLMTKEQATMIYQRMWNLQGYGRFNDQAMAAKVFDLMVNMGPRRVFRKQVTGGAHVLVQRAVRALGGGKRLLEDGILGVKSFTALNTIAVDDEWYPQYMAALCSEAAGYYRSLNRPKYIKGWLNRAYWRPDI